MTKLKIYRVTYAITREETYTVKAASEAEARAIDAFANGVFESTGETLDVKERGIEVQND